MTDMPEVSREQPQETAAQPNKLPANDTFKGVIRRTKKAGVAQTGISTQLAHIKRFSQITSLHRKMAAFTARKQVESFVADVRNRQPHQKSDTGKKPTKSLSPDWQKLDMVLPNGASGGERLRIDSPGSPFPTSGGLSVGQVIPPLEPQQSSQSAFSKRMQKIVEGSKPEPAQPKKRIAPQSRLYSKTVEIDPRRAAVQPEAAIDRDNSIQDQANPPTADPAKSQTKLIQVLPNREKQQQFSPMQEPDTRRVPHLPESEHTNPPQKSTDTHSTDLPHPSENLPDRRIKHSAPNNIQRQPETVRHDVETPTPQKTASDQEPKLAPEQVQSDMPVRNSAAELPASHLKRLRPAPLKSLLQKPVTQPSAAQPDERQSELLPVNLISQTPVSAAEKPEPSPETLPDISSQPLAETPDRASKLISPQQQGKIEPTQALQMPLTLKPGIRPVRRFITPVQPLSHVRIALNINRPPLQKTGSRPHSPVLLDLTRHKQTGQAAIVQEQQPPEKMYGQAGSIKMDLPSPGRTRVTEDHKAIPETIKPLPGFLTVRQTVQRTPAAEKVRPTPVPTLKLAAPLQRMISKKRTQQIGVLTRMQAPHPAAKPPVQAPAISAMAALPHMILSDLHLEVLNPQVQAGMETHITRAAAVPPAKRSLIKLPVLVRQNRTPKKKIQHRVENRSQVKSGASSLPSSSTGGNPPSALSLLKSGFKPTSPADDLMNQQLERFMKGSEKKKPSIRQRTITSDTNHLAPELPVVHTPVQTGPSDTIQRIESDLTDTTPSNLSAERLEPEIYEMPGSLKPEPAKPKLNQLARAVLPLIKKMMTIENERSLHR